MQRRTLAPAHSQGQGDEQSAANNDIQSTDKIVKDILEMLDREDASSQQADAHTGFVALNASVISNEPALIPPQLHSTSQAINSTNMPYPNNDSTFTPQLPKGPQFDAGFQKLDVAIFDPTTKLVKYYVDCGYLWDHAPQYRETLTNIHWCRLQGIINTNLMMSIPEIAPLPTYGATHHTGQMGNGVHTRDSNSGAGQGLMVQSQPSAMGVSNSTVTPKKKESSRAPHTPPRTNSAAQHDLYQSDLSNDTGTSQHSSGTGASEVLSPEDKFPKLKTFQSYKPYNRNCTQCGVKVSVTKGNNDGKFCTRCFKGWEMEYNHKRETYRKSLLASSVPESLNKTAHADAANAQQSGPVTLHHHSGSGGKRPIALAPPKVVLDIDQSGHASVVPGNTQASYTLQDTSDHSQGALNPPTTYPARLSSSNISPRSRRSEAASSSSFDIEHESVEAAREYVFRPPANDCMKLDLGADNWQSVRENFNAYCEELFNALQVPGSGPPDYLNNFEKAYFTEHQETTLQSVQKEMLTAEQITYCKARVMLAMDEVVAVHEVGIPLSSLESRSGRWNRGYQPDTKSDCVQRARKVIHYARTSKYVALDIIKGVNIADLARSPDRYVQRKVDNLQNNASRSQQVQSVKKLRKGEKSADDIAKEAPTKRGRKPRLGFVPGESSFAVETGQKRKSGAVTDTPNDDRENKRTKHKQYGKSETMAEAREAVEHKEPDDDFARFRE